MIWKFRSRREFLSSITAVSLRFLVGQKAWSQTASAAIAAPNPGDPIVLQASGTKLASSIAVAPLHTIGDNAAHKDRIATNELSLRPWNGKSFKDYEWLYPPATGFTFRLQAAQLKDCARAVVGFWDWSGNLVYSKTYSSFPIDDVLHVKAECHGVWLVTFDTYADETAASLKERLLKSFGTPVDASSACDRWRKESDYSIGSCFFPARYYHWGKQWQFDNSPYPELTPAEGIERLVKLAARAGIATLRIDHFGQPGSPGGKSDWAGLAEVLGILQRYSIQADLKVNMPPQCFIGKSLERNPEVFATWDSDLDYLIHHFLSSGDTKVALVELGNEPAHKEFWAGTREQYEWLFAYAQKKIHLANPGLTVIHGATCPPGSDLAGEKLKDPAVFAEMKNAEENWYLDFYRDMGKTMDVWAYHQHQNLNADTFAWRTWERSELSKDGFKGKFIVTEGGACAWRPDLEVTTWAPFLQRIIYSWSCGDIGWLQFDLAFMTTPDRCDGKQGWAMIYAREFAPKFLYGALAAMSLTMAGCTLDRTLFLNKSGDTPSLAVLFNHPKGKMIAWFGASAQAALHIQSDANASILVDPMGNGGEPVSGGDATLRFALYPQYLLLTGATRVNSVAQKS